MFGHRCAVLAQEAAMMMRMNRRSMTATSPKGERAKRVLKLGPLVIACSLSSVGCKGGDGEADDDAADATTSSADASSDTTGDTGTDTGGDEPLTATITHRFGELTLTPYEEREDCLQWTLDNDEAIYVQKVTLSNLGYWHHSNWFVVPEDTFAGEDGYYNCSDRGFTEIGAATAGTVLFAQSTQSFVEEQQTGEGAVIKIPPRHKVVAGIHLLNAGPSTVDTDLFMTLDLIHPKDVSIVLTPFRLSYLDLQIPPLAESHFTGRCDTLAEKYMGATGQPLDIKLHYVLPHYHYLGNYFNLTFTGGGGELDGQTVYEHSGFDGGANGLTFDPPLDISSITGLRYTCGYDNWRDVEVNWGIGDQEMCVMLGLAESRVLMDITVTGGTVAVGQTPEGVYEFEGPCGVLAVAKNPAQGPPTSAEIEGPFYIPPTKPEDENIPPVPECEDHDPSVEPELEPTLTNVFAGVFNQSCAFNACHGSSGGAAGLDLQAADLHAELLGHETLGNPGMALVEPGDPDNSWLYQVMSQCAPMGETGVRPHMPLNAPFLMEDEAIAIVREWIAAGALND
jgi:hypothetical protein